MTIQIELEEDELNTIYESLDYTKENSALSSTKQRIRELQKKITEDL